MATRKPKSTADKVQGLRRSLDEPDPGHAPDVLARLFRKLVVDLDYDDVNKWNYLMNMYIADRRNAIPRNKREQASARGNLQKELLKDEMSWNVFIKGLKFLNLKGYELVLVAHHQDGTHTSHKLEPTGLGTRLISPEDIPLPQPFKKYEVSAKVKTPNGTTIVESETFENDIIGIEDDTSEYDGIDYD